MKVKDLIAELEKFSPEAEVEAYLEFETDQGYGSCPGEVCSIEKTVVGNKVVITVADIFTLGGI
jgi:hypothetical protein